MSVDVVYSEVVFVKRNTVDSPEQCQLGDSSQASQQAKRCVQLLLMAVCTLTALLMVGLITLGFQYVYTEKKLKDLQQLHFSLNENFTAFSAVHQDLHHRQQNLSRALIASACPKDWEYHAGRCYYFSSNTMDWTKSRDACITDGGHLVIINSRDEQEFLMSIIKMKNEVFWIGLTDGKFESQWLWVDNTKLSLRYWIKNEPDNWGGHSNTGEDCAIMTPQFNQVLDSWFDRFCGQLHRRICETRSSRQT